MMQRVLVVAMVATMFMAAAPTAESQIQNPEGSTDTQLYFHIWDPFTKFVVNNQPYNASFFEIGGQNFPTTPETGDFNTIYGYSTAGPVEYDFIESGRPRIHPERGIAADVQLDPDVQPKGYFYLDVRDMFGGDAIPGTLPEMTFRYTMREGDDPGSNLDEGPLIMQGETTAYLVDGAWCPGNIAKSTSLLNLGECVGEQEVDPHDQGGYDDFPQETADGTPIFYPDEAGVIEIPIDLTKEQDVIKKATAYNIRIDWFQNPQDSGEDDEYAQGTMRVVLDKDHLPRIEFSILNPVYIDFIHPQVAAGTLLIHSGVNSPWGTFDVDVENIKVSVDGPTTPANLQQVVAQNAHVHGKHHEAAEVTYLWKFRDEGAENGEYTINMEVPNVEGTAVATGQAGFTVQGQRAFGTDEGGNIVESSDDGGDDEESPGVPVLGALAMLGALVAFRRWKA